MPPDISPKIRSVCLCNLPRLPRSLVCRLEEAGFLTVGDCLDRWLVLAMAAKSARDRDEGAPKGFGRAHLKRLRAVLVYYNRTGAPEIDKRRDEPTPEEISQRCAEIRAGWDDARWSERAIGANPIPIGVPCFGYCQFDHEYWCNSDYG